VNAKAIRVGMILAITLGLELPPSSTAAPQGRTQVQHFVCNIGYTLDECHLEMMVLRRALAKYPTNALGDWTWVLVHSKDWCPILLDRGFDPNTPAISYLSKRETFFDEALLQRESTRGFELGRIWRMTVDELLDLAIRHELGHALCNERDEREASRTAGLLSEGKPLSCHVEMVKSRTGR
jgi:hypothetical protein